MRILVVNPNTSVAMTGKIGAAARTVAAPGTEIVVEGYQAKDKSNRAVGKYITFADGRRLFLGLSSAESDPDKK